MSLILKQAEKKAFTYTVVELFFNSHITSQLQFLFSPLSPPILSPQDPLLLLSLQKRAGLPSQGYQPNKAYQVIVRLGAFPHIKAGQGSQKRVTETASILIVRSPTGIPSYTTLTYAEDLSQTLQTPSPSLLQWILGYFSCKL